MRTLVRPLLAVAALAAAGVGALVLWPIGTPAAIAPAQGDAARGAYLARVGGCIACHSDPGSGRPALTGGAPIVSPFGTFVPPNITTDPVAGIGNWSLDDFARAVRQGISPDGAPYYPAFPYAFYAGLTDQDVADLWAAFRTLPADPEPASTHELTFPFNLRFGLKPWRVAYHWSPDTNPDPERSDAWNRGKWLVNGPGHCGACHTDRNLLGGRIPARHLAGSDDLPEGGKAPGITAPHLTEAGWTVPTLAYALGSGVTPDGDTFGGGMGEVVQQGLRWISAEDREAIALYLLDRDAAEGDQ